MNNQKKLSIVIPALNEEETIGFVIKKALSVVAKLGIQAEIIVADNASSDNTRKISEQLGAHVVRVENRGYGCALQGGFNAAEGNYILMADADDSYNLEDIEPFILKLDEGYDLVMGNRFKGEFVPGAMPFLNRYLGTPVLSFVINSLFGIDIGDVNCGMRAIRKEAYQRIKCQAPGMEFASEMLVQSSLHHLKIAEVPCTLYKDKRSRLPHLMPWVDGLRHLKLILRSKFKTRSAQ